MASGGGQGSDRQASSGARRHVAWVAAVAIGALALAIGALLVDGSDRPPDRPAGPPSATAERDGILLELWLDRVQVRLGERLLAHVRVTNHGTTSPEREGNECPDGPAPVKVTGQGGMLGRNWAGVAGDFKQLALEEAGALHGGSQVMGLFRDVRYMDRIVPVGCPAASIRQRFNPGEVLEATIAWDVAPDEARTPRPGPAIIVATFSSSAGDLELEVEVEIGVGQLPAAMGLVDYVDAALSSEEFRRWLTGQPPESWSNTSIIHWPNPQGEYPALPEYEGVDVPVVQVGLYREVGDGFELGAVLVDARTGTVIGTLFGPPP